jgi:hypothetical protein
MGGLAAGKCVTEDAEEELVTALGCIGFAELVFKSQWTSRHIKPFSQTSARSKREHRNRRLFVLLGPS